MSETAPFSPVQAAFETVLNAPDQASRDAAWSSMTALASGGQHGSASTIYGDLNRRASEMALNASTSGAKSAALDVIERTAAALSGTRPEVDAAPADEGLGFEPGRSPGDYRLPPDLSRQLADEAGFAVVQQAAHAAGIPQQLWGQMVKEGAGLRHLLGDAPGYDDAVTKCRAELDRMLPEATRMATIQAGVGYLSKLATDHPPLREAVELLFASPWAVVTAANLAKLKR